MKRWLLVLGVLGAFLVFGSVVALAADQPASPPAQKDEVVGCGGGSAPAEQAAPADQDGQVKAGSPRMMAGGMMGMMSFRMMEAPAVVSCSGPDDGWFLEVLRGTDQTKLKAALAKLDADPDAKALLATKEAGVIRQIIETGKVPELSLDELHDLSLSSHTARLLRALHQVLKIQRTLAI